MSFDWLDTSSWIAAALVLLVMTLCFFVIIFLSPIIMTRVSVWPLASFLMPHAVLTAGFGFSWAAAADLWLETFALLSEAFDSVS